jgi:Anti-sigma-K factor rskA, C-terminal
VSAPALPRNHDEYEALAVAWAINALEPADQVVFDAHRDGCRRCARTVSTTLAVATELAYGVPDVVPPPRLRERVLAAASPRIALTPRTEKAPGVGQDSRTGSTPGTRGTDHPASATDGVSGAATGRTGEVGSAAGTLSSANAGIWGGSEVVAGGIDVAGRRDSAGRNEDGRRPEPGGTGRGRAAARAAGRVRRRRRIVYALAAAVLVAGSAVTTWEVTRPAPAADRVAALSAGGGTVATVVAHPKGAADVVTDSLPPNTGRGTAYYLWGVPPGDGSTPQVIGTFEVNASGLHSYRVRLTRPLAGYPVLAVSEEPAGSAPTSPSSVLGRGALRA